MRRTDSKSVAVWLERRRDQNNNFLFILIFTYFPDIRPSPHEIFCLGRVLSEVIFSLWYIGENDLV